MGGCSGRVDDDAVVRREDLARNRVNECVGNAHTGGQEILPALDGPRAGVGTEGDHPA